jgi:hypothetical protein
MSCGTIACAGGWLAMHPVMNQAGLSASEGGSPRTDKTDWGFGALREVFNLQPGEEELFEAHGTGYKDEELTEKQITAMSGKRLWKRRVLRLFQEYNEPFDPTAGRGLMLRARNA